MTVIEVIAAAIVVALLGLPVAAAVAALMDIVRPRVWPWTDGLFGVAAGLAIVVNVGGGKSGSGSHLTGGDIISILCTLALTAVRSSEH